MNIWILSAIILTIVVLSKLIAKKTSSVDVIWLILFGAIFANLGMIDAHNETLEVIGEWGIVFIMFALGFDEDLSHFKDGLKRSWGIAIFGALFPFFGAFYTAKYFGFDTNAAMLWGLTMTATAVSLTMVSLKNENLHRTKAATGIMTAAVIDDVLSLIGVAIVIPLVLVSSGSLDSGFGFGEIAIIVLKVIIFFAIVIFLGLFAFPEKTPKTLPQNATLWQRAEYKVSSLLKSINIRGLILAYQGEFTPLIMISIAMTLGAIAFLFGFHPAIGAYLAGLFLKKEYFIFDNEDDRRTDQHFEQSKSVIDHFAFTVFGPIFFVNLGAKIEFDFHLFTEALPMIVTLFIVVFIVQVLSASISAKYTGGYSTKESVMIGFGMLGRAELAFVVINLAFTQHHIISEVQFYTLVMTIFLLNISVPSTIKWFKPYFLGEKEFIFGRKLLAKGVV
jgi:Kef-type K+ transport system membrane component KefB